MNVSHLSEEELLDVIKRCAEELGWGIATPIMADGATIPGLVMGTDAYVDLMLEGS